MGASLSEAFAGVDSRHTAVMAARIVYSTGLAGGVVLCILGYFVLVQQLRAGIRTSSNENAFSPG
jgi:cell division protein FtsW (lipid II flippase)